MTLHQEERRFHWDDRYRSIGERSVSWFEAEPAVSLELIELVGATPEKSVIDVGGGASGLTAKLQRRGFMDLTVLDISAEAISASKGPVERPDSVTWVQADVMNWEPGRRWSVWHDRALFHFLTDPSDRRRYLELLRLSLEPGGALIIATFAEDGPTTCSGLAVERYSAEQLLAAIGPGFTEVDHRRHEHVTPSGGIQPFTWIAARAASP